MASGNYIDKVPEGFDVAIMKCVSGEYNDEQFERILRNLRAAMAQGSKVYLVDLILDRSHKDYLVERHFDINWWGLTGGKVRSREEIERLLVK